MLPLVSIVILNYNCKQHIVGCLEAVKAIDYPNLQVTIVDNASTDGSRELIEREYPFFELLRSAENIGFAAGNNIGIANASGEYVLLLNPDTEIDSQCVTRMVEVLNSDEKIAVCGAKIFLLDLPTTLQHAGGQYSLIGASIDRGMCEVDMGQFDRIEETTFVCGAAMMFRRSLVSEIGPLDPAFFLYHEDVDFCIRAWFHGKKVVYVPGAVVYHKSGFLSDLGKHVSNPNVVFHKQKNTLVILLKNFSASTVLAWFPVSVFYKFFWALLFLNKKDEKSAISVLRSILWVFKNLPRINKDRKKTFRARIVNDRLVSSLFVSPGIAWNVYRKLSRF